MQQEFPCLQVNTGLKSNGSKNTPSAELYCKTLLWREEEN